MAKIYVNRNGEIVNPNDDKFDWLNGNDQTFTRQQVEDKIGRASCRERV